MSLAVTVTTGKCLIGLNVGSTKRLKIIRKEYVKQNHTSPRAGLAISDKRLSPGRKRSHSSTV